jgi:hypothetical protein
VGDSTVSDMAVVLALTLGHVDGEERATGYPGVGLRRRRLPDRVRRPDLGIVGGMRYRA